MRCSYVPSAAPKGWPSGYAAVRPDSVSNACARRPHTCLATSSLAATTTPGHQNALRQ
jgi:hypothetical protein